MTTDGGAAAAHDRSGVGGWLRVLVLTAVAAVGVGAVGGSFRWLLARADEARALLVAWTHEQPALGWIVPVALTAVAAGLAAGIVRLVPLASGSGIPHVEAVDRGEAPPPPLTVLPARFLGGLLSIGAGLVLGREGPTVHMAASLGAAAATAGRLGARGVRQMQTALAGAGLAVAFNAPIGGALFVFEEVTKSFRARMVVLTAVAVAVAVGVSRLVTGDAPDFAVVAPQTPSLWTLPLFAAFGVLLGGVGALYNRVVLASVDGAARLRRVPAPLRAAIIGAIVGAVMFVDPLAVGGGDTLTQLLLAGHAVAAPVLLAYLAVRFLAGPLSYASGTPGGLFAPLLALGALSGVLFADASSALLPGLPPDTGVALALVGMSALFAAAVRAPFTGIVIVLEMTAVTSVTIPMLIASGLAALTARALRSTPIYDSLADRMPAARDPGAR